MLRNLTSSFKMNFMRIQLSIIILRKMLEILVYFCNFKIPILKNIINIVKFEATFVI